MKRLYRSTQHKLLAGVCGGFGEYFNIDPVIIRIIAIVIAVVTGIVPMVLVYLLMIFMVPQEQTTIHDIDA